MKEKMKHTEKKKIVNFAFVMVDKYPFFNNPIFQNLENYRPKD